MSEVKEKKADKDDDKHDHDKKIMVAVYTTSGAFPDDGYDKINAKEIVAKFLEKAAKKLKLTSVEGWIATVDGREIDPHKSFHDNGLTGTVTIQWGPREGGGG